MNVLALDTATTSTSVALARADGWLREARDDAPPGERPAHARRVLELAAGLLVEAELGWEEIGTVAVGVGPGGYTGLRIGLATAHGLAAAHGAALLGVGSLRALAEPLAPAGAVAVLDARRGEAFVAVYRDREELVAPRVCAPTELAQLALQGGPLALAVGDGALRFRELIERGGSAVAPADSPLHRVSAAAICRLALGRETTSAVPMYLRLADAEIALNAKT